MRRRLGFALAVTAMTAAAPTFSAPTDAETVGFTPPNGCDLLATVQQKSCMVWQIMVCDDDHPDDRQVYEFENGGLVTIYRDIGGLVDRDVAYLDDGVTLSILVEDPDAIRAFDVSDSSARLVVEAAGLMNTGGYGSDPIDRPLLFETHISGASGALDVSGRTVLALSGGTAIAADLGEAMLQATAEGSQYYDEGLGATVGYTALSTVLSPSESVERIDQTPIEIATPGQLGFGATAPISACEGLQTLGPAQTIR